ncbi:MAG: hypothetical protein J7K72_01815 [Candidatus Aenigmarchaeota archaeon]|nr:hypothetical protein [Candidatus Aenigmarchaeota archaeon]
MEKKICILPLISLALLLSFYINPDITGFMVASPEAKIFANVSISISPDGFIPEDSVIMIYLDKRNASMNIKDFIKKTGEAYDYREGELKEIGYRGFGFGGVYSYSLPISEFDIDCKVHPGKHNLTTEVIYKDFVLSRSAESIYI